MIAISKADPIREQFAQYVERSALDMLDADRLQAIAEDHVSTCVCDTMYSEGRTSSFSAVVLMQTRASSMLQAGLGYATTTRGWWWSA